MRNGKILLIPTTKKEIDNGMTRFLKKGLVNNGHLECERIPARRQITLTWG